MEDLVIASTLKNVLDNVAHQAQVNLETIKCFAEIAKLLEEHGDNSKLLNQIESLLRVNNALVENFTSATVLTTDTLMTKPDEKENATKQ